MSTRDLPTLVRTTGISPSDGSETSGEDPRRLRATVDALETELAETRTRLRARERELAATRERLAESERAREDAADWAALLGEELREREARIETLRAERDRKARHADQVVDRYEELLADAGGSEERESKGLLARVRSYYRSVAPFSSM